MNTVELTMDQAYDRLDELVVLISSNNFRVTEKGTGVIIPNSAINETSLQSNLDEINTLCAQTGNMFADNPTVMEEVSKPNVVDGQYMGETTHEQIALNDKGHKRLRHLYIGKPSDKHTADKRKSALRRS